ncbi:putative Malectin domain-containing protein [Azospirillaceae bacterium]
MSDAKEPQPPRFAVQRAAGKSWKTIYLAEEQAASTQVFHEMIRLKPTGFFRLIRLEYDPNAQEGALEFHWKLISLHDPRKSVVAKNVALQKKGRRRRSGEKTPIPLRIYLLAIVLGVVAAIALWLRLGVGGGLNLVLQ